MSSMTNYLENKLIDHIFRGQTFAAPTTLYVALFTSATDDAGGGTEVTGGGYARVAIACSLANWAGTQGAGTTTASSGTGGQTSNNVEVLFPAPTADWNTITHFGIYDAPTGGNMLAHAPLTSSKVVNNGDAAPSFPIGVMTHTLS